MGKEQANKEHPRADARPSAMSRGRRSKRPAAVAAMALGLTLGASPAGALPPTTASSGATTTTSSTATTTTAASTTTTTTTTSTGSATVPGREWVLTSPEAHGLDRAPIDQALDYALTDGRNTQGVVVVHKGEVVAERYAAGADASSWAASWSVAKSFAGTLVGIAIDEGKIPNVDVPMTTYFPEWAGTPKEAITLRHVLQQATGLDWDESYDPATLADSEVIAMVVNERDQLTYAAGRPLEHAPGTVFNYSSGNSMLLSAVIEQATGMRAEDYARSRLVEPLGFSKFDWWRDAEGNTLTYCCVDTTTRDFARFGLLYMNGGRWGDRQVVSKAWVDAAITGSPVSNGRYGLQWWVEAAQGNVPAHFAARGHDGQYVHVFPELDLVVARNGYYGKSPCPAVADPALLPYYPPQNLSPGWGTVPPQGWSAAQLLGPIVASVTGEAFTPQQYPAPTTGKPVPTGPAAACPGTDGAPPAPGGSEQPVTAVRPATAVRAQPTFTG